MTTLIVPFGSDPDHPLFYLPNSFAETHFSRGSGSGLTASVRATIADVSHLTTPGGLGVDTLTDYATMDQDAWSAAQPSSALGVGLSVHARQDAAAVIPSDVTAFTSAKLVVVAKSTAASLDDGRSFAISVLGLTEDTGDVLVSVSANALRATEWGRYEITSSPLLNTVDEWREALAWRGMVASLEVVTPPGTYADGVTSVAYLGVELTWDDAVPPVTSDGRLAARRRPGALRQMQRGDAHGMSTAPRALQHNSVQGSLRNIGFD